MDIGVAQQANFSVFGQDRVFEGFRWFEVAGDESSKYARCLVVVTARQAEHKPVATQQFPFAVAEDSTDFMIDKSYLATPVRRRQQRPVGSRCCWH
jgi:hypothetical protein